MTTVMPYTSYLVPLARTLLDWVKHVPISMIVLKLFHHDIQWVPTDYFGALLSQVHQIHCYSCYLLLSSEEMLIPCSFLCVLFLFPVICIFEFMEMPSLGKDFMMAGSCFRENNRIYTVGNLWEGTLNWALGAEYNRVYILGNECI